MLKNLNKIKSLKPNTFKVNKINLNILSSK